MPAAAPTPDELRDLIDKSALRELVYAYARAADRRDYALMRSLYTEDGTDDHGHMFKGSADNYVKWLPSILETWQTTLHVVCNTEFKLDGDQAEGDVYKISYHRTLPPQYDDVISGGRYVDKYRRCADAKWRFAARRLAQDWTWRQPSAAFGYREAGPGLTESQGGADDVLYTWHTLFKRGER
jgi:hypothetical protein